MAALSLLWLQNKTTSLSIYGQPRLLAVSYTRAVFHHFSHPLNGSPTVFSISPRLNRLFTSRCRTPLTVHHQECPLCWSCGTTDHTSAEYERLQHVQRNNRAGGMVSSQKPHMKWVCGRNFPGTQKWWRGNYSILHSFVANALDAKIPDLTTRRPSKLPLKTVSARHGIILPTFTKECNSTFNAYRELWIPKNNAGNGAQYKSVVCVGETRYTSSRKLLREVLK